MPVSRSSKAGFSLVEMLVSVVILSILASVAMPYAERGLIRAKEMELRRALRDIRAAIDEFHRDCKDGYILKNQEAVSPNCLPVTLDVLVAGVDGGETGAQRLRYLRRIPRDPLQSGETPVEEQWGYRGYADDADSSIWDGIDVYDIYVPRDATALDGSNYREW